LLSLDARLCLGVDTGGENLVPAREGREGMSLSCPRIVQPWELCPRLILWKKEGSHENAKQIRAG